MPHFSNDIMALKGLIEDNIIGTNSSKRGQFRRKEPSTNTSGQKHKGKIRESETRMTCILPSTGQA